MDKKGVRLMNAKITLTVNGGRLDGKEYTFADQKVYVIGRGSDCDLQMPSAEEFQTVSRRHCLLCVDLPNVRLRDLGSRNGTIVNGEQIGRPECWPLPDELGVGPLTEHELKDGDEFKVGGAVFKVRISDELREIPKPEFPMQRGNDLCVCG
jgi:pSer/pThr/pTyr-binding forkhead associated (FHA) protein